MTQTCILCHKSDQEKIVLNDLPLLRCRRCGLIRREEFDVPISHYEELDAGDTLEKRRIRFRNSIDRIRLFSKFVPLSGWCDIGTGEGIFLEALAAAGGQGSGIEPSEESRVKAIEHGVKIAGHTIEDISAVSKTESVSVVSLFHVVEHLEYPDIEIKRIYDALPPGGFLIVETPNIDSRVFALHEYKDSLIYPEHLWYFSEKTLQTLLEQGGFHIVASGRRDFNQYNLPIRESLCRLGLSAKNPLRKAIAKHVTTDGNWQRESRSANENMVRVLVRRILSRLVIMTGRLQYVWIVAQK